MHPLDILDHIVDVLITRLDPKLLVDNGMHLRDSEPALEKKLDLFLNLLVRDDVTVFDLNLVVVVHAHRARPEVPHTVLTPLELAVDRAVCQQGLLKLDSLVKLFISSCSSIATE